MDELEAISPIDGRYRKDVSELEKYFSEFALMKYRVKVEIEYLIALLEFLGKSRKLSEDEKTFLRRISTNFSLEDANRIKEIEKETRHDLQAVVNFVIEKINKSSLNDVKGLVHFGLTSYDITDTAYSLMLKDALTDVYIPLLQQLLNKLIELAEKYKTVVMLARTHGQPASPTTVGKEFANFAYRLDERIKVIREIKLPGKFGGATGNYNALVAAYPNLNWVAFMVDFISSLGLEPKFLTTQITVRENIVDLLNTIRSINNIILDLDRDMWLYISYDYFVQEAKEKEVGSTAMPHKVNPIDFENSEGNLEYVNSILDMIAGKIQISRMQRDLSDSTVKRNYGVAFAHSILAYKNTLKGLGRIVPNFDKLQEDLLNHPEVIAEGIQTILKREGYEEAYEKVKDLTRGKKVTLKEIQAFIRDLDIPEYVKKEILELRPENYVGLADKLTEIGLLLKSIKESK